MLHQIKNQNGYTLVELVIILIILMATLILFLNSCVSEQNRNRAKEAEVRANTHMIQVALDRYGVDSGGVYPIMLYGGDSTDSFTTSKSPDYTIENGTKTLSGVSEYDGDVDVLLEYRYLSQYPVNPFQRSRDPEKYGRFICEPSKYNLPPMSKRVNIWANHPNPTHSTNPDRSQQMVPRQVGGEHGNLMWDVSEGQRHAPFPLIKVPDPDPNDPGNYYQYINPTQPADAPTGERSYLFYLLPGNFYYYATFAEPCGYTSFNKDDPNIPVVSTPINYNLVYYGYYENPGFDVYNILGDYPERSLGTANNPDQKTDSQDSNIIYSGPDGRLDGVIVVFQGGWDKNIDPKVIEDLS